MWRSQWNVSTPLKICSVFLSSLSFSQKKHVFGLFSGKCHKESISMAKKENTWTMISHWLPLTTPPIWGSCQLYKSSLQHRNQLIFHPYSISLLKSHRYPEQHDKNNNALFTGQYIVTVQLSLPVDIWICLLGIINLTMVNLWGQQIRKSAVSWKQSITSVHKLFSNLNFSRRFTIIIWLHYMLNSYHCTDYGICFFLFITVDL